MKGFWNRLLRIDLDRGTWRTEPLSDDLLARTMGGKGLGTALLLAENPPGVDAVILEGRRARTGCVSPASSPTGGGAWAAAAWEPSSAELGLEDLAIHVKGLEPAGFEPRVLKGMGLSYATAARGACHLRGTFYKAELAGLVDKAAVAGKAAQVIDYEDRAALFDSLILCRFFRDLILWDELGALIAAATGLAMTREELEGLANEITLATRRFNLREGLTAADDTLPPRFLREKTAEGMSLGPEEMDVMLGEYNAVRESRRRRSS